MAQNEKRTLSIIARLEDFASQQASRMGVSIEKTIAGRIVGSLKRWRSELGTLRSAWRSAWNAASAPIRVPLSLIDRLTKKLFSVKNLITGFVAFRIGRSILGNFNELAADLDKVAKLGDRIAGTSESLTALRFASQLAGTSLDELRPGFIALQKNIQLAKVGSVEQRTALADLGIELDSLNTRHIDYIDLLARVADSYGKLNGAAERTAALSNAFGRSGTALAPLLEQGSKGILELAAEARKRGLVFTREELARAEQYADAMLRIRTALRATFERLFLSSAAGLSAILDRATAFIEANRDRIIGAFEAGGRALLKMIDLVSDGIIGLIGLIESIPFFDLGTRQELARVQSMIDAIDAVKSAGGADAIREANARTFPELRVNRFGGSFPGSGLKLEEVEAILPQEAELRAKAEQLGVVLSTGIASGLRSQKAALLEGITSAFQGGSTGGTQNDLYRSILAQAGVRTDEDVVRAVGAGLIPPEALLEGVRTGLFSSGVLDRIHEIVGRTVSEKLAPSQQDLRGQAVRIRELTELESALLSLERPTAAVQARLAQLNAEAQKADIAQRLLPQFEAGKVSAEGLASVMELLEGNTARALAALERAEKLNTLGFRRDQLDQLDQQPSSRSAEVERVQIGGEERKLQLQEAFDQGRLSADEFTLAVQRADAATERLAARARGDFALGFAEAATAGIESFTNMTAIGEQAADQLVNGGLSRMVDGLAGVIDGTKKGKEAFKEFARSMLSSLSQIIAKLLIVAALQALGRGLGLAGTGIGDALGINRKAEGGIIQGRLLSMRKFADGGIAHRPTLGLFGEAGAEAFVPLRGGKIPVALTGRSGEPPLTVQFNVQATDADSFRALLQNERHQLAGLVQNSIETRRGMRRTVRRAVR